jgi:hypothetical protein
MAITGGGNPTISDLPRPQDWLDKAGQMSNIGTQMMTSIRWACLWLWASGPTATRPINPLRGQLFWDSTLDSFVVARNANPVIWQVLSSAIIPINTQTANYVLALSDAGICVEMNGAGANTLTIPPFATVPWKANTMIMVRQEGAGVTTITAGAGVTLHTPATAAITAQYGTVSLHNRATDEWCMDGRC